MVLVQMLVLELQLVVSLVLVLVLELVGSRELVWVLVFVLVQVPVRILEVVLGTGHHQLQERQDQHLRRRILSEKLLPGSSWCYRSSGGSGIRNQEEPRRSPGGAQEELSPWLSL